MNRVGFGLIAALVVVLGVTVAAAQKKPYNSQTTHTFANVEQTAAQGLHIQLSSPAMVVTDPGTGAAGPFRNVVGNGSSNIVLSNPTEPIAAAGGDRSSVELMFRSQKSRLDIKSWWWVDAKGKRIGKKQKG